MKRKRGRAPAKRLLLTDRGLSDIAAIEQYSVEQWGKKTAAKYIAQIEESLSLIQEKPQLLQTLAGLHPFLQFYTVNRHVLVFDVDDNDVILLTVFHSSMDIPLRLTELEPTLSAEVEMLHGRMKDQ